MPKLSKKLDQFSESVIRRMTRVAREHGAINLSQGFPDFDPPAALTAALERVALPGPHQYAVTWGAPEFRAALVRKQSRLMGIPLDADDNVVVTCGSTEAMMVAMMTVCDPGDKVIVFSPFYENYGADTILSGATQIYVHLRFPSFEFNERELEAAFEQRPKALVLCNPANPTGKVFTRRELEIIAELAAKYDAFVLTDEVYEHIVYPPARHEYFASLPGMFERTLSCSSLSKTYSITGWRIGYVLAPKFVIHQARKVHDFLTVGAPAPLQEAALTALAFPESYYEGLIADYSEKRDVFLAALDRAGLRYSRPQGAYYVLVDISRYGAPDDVAFAEWMAKEVGVAGVPGSSFFREPVHDFVRFHFAKRRETLEEAGRRLLRLDELAEKRWGIRRNAESLARPAQST
ncbi:MAG TPA: aminotransferase class I/II-fold pyridoxal phosphate-dependent enzyme [Polyangiaceae bacterium]